MFTLNYLLSIVDFQPHHLDLIYDHFRNLHDRLRVCQDFYSSSKQRNADKNSNLSLPDFGWQQVQRDKEASKQVRLLLIAYRDNHLSEEDLGKEISKVLKLDAYLCSLNQFITQIYDYSLMTNEELEGWRQEIFVLEGYKAEEHLEKYLWKVGGRYRLSLLREVFPEDKRQVGQKLTFINDLFMSNPTLDISIEEVVEEDGYRRYLLAIKSEGFVIEGQIYENLETKGHVLELEVAIAYDYLPGLSGLSAADRFAIFKKPKIFAAYLISKQFLEWANLSNAGLESDCPFESYQSIDGIWQEFFYFSKSVSDEEIDLLAEKLSQEEIVIDQDAKTAYLLRGREFCGDNWDEEKVEKRFSTYQFIYDLTKERLESYWSFFLQKPRTSEHLLTAHKVFKNEVLAYLMSLKAKEIPSESLASYIGFLNKQKRLLVLTKWSNRAVKTMLALSWLLGSAVILYDLQFFDGGRPIFNLINDRTWARALIALSMIIFVYAGNLLQIKERVLSKSDIIQQLVMTLFIIGSAYYGLFQLAYQTFWLSIGFVLAYFIGIVIVLNDDIF